MWYIVYNLFFFLVSPVAILLLSAKKRSRKGFWQRVGLLLPPRLNFQRQTLWFHAVSMGEVLAVVPLVIAMHKQYPQLGIVVSTTTETGREAVEQHLGSFAQHCYLPLDCSWAVRRFIRHIQPLGFIVVETELWPNLLRYLYQNGVASVIVNGRLSSRSFRRYQWVAFFMKQVLASLTLCLMQSERDKQRLVALGANPETVYCTGNMKFDHVVPEQSESQVSNTRAGLGLTNDENVIVAGSTHPEEEEILLECYRDIVKKFKEVVLLLAPRHIERIDEVEKVVKAYGFHAIRKSKIKDCILDAEFHASPKVIILDTHGDLAKIYSLATLAFVGGTLVSVGGHNLLEPAIWAKPVFFGPFTDHCQEIADLLLEAGGGMQVQGRYELTNLFIQAIQNPEWTDQIGKKARQVVLDNQGSVERNLNLIRTILDSRVL